jgi:hypothetical protein
MRARAAHCDVTPRDRPVRLAGFASRQAPVSTIRDPLEISALLLEDGGRRCLILGFDVMIVGAELAGMILSRLSGLGFKPEEVTMLASHTHCAPATGRACARVGEPEAQFVADAADAVEHLVHRILRDRPRPASFDVFRGQLDHSINRRRRWPFPTWDRTQGLQWASVTFSPYPAGPRDERTTVVVVRDQEDRTPLASFWHYACHPTSTIPFDVISADFPGAVRGMLRERFGEIPCLFMLGFCGDITPRIAPSPQRLSLPEHARKLLRVIVAGYMVPTVSAADSLAWQRSVVAGLDAIIAAGPERTLQPQRLRSGSATIPLSDFFAGVAFHNRLAARVIQLGAELEILALSAEPTVEWQHILDGVVPPAPGAIRLYVGYLGAVFGYLPTARQVPEGGYEVNGFQSLFGMSGRFDAEKIGPAVARCVESAFANLEQTSDGAVSLAGAG